MNCLKWWQGHVWGPWTVVSTGTLTVAALWETEYRPVGTVVTQQRLCARCGLTQIRKDTASVA